MQFCLALTEDRLIGLLRLYRLRCSHRGNKVTHGSWSGAFDLGCRDQNTHCGWHGTKRAFLNNKRIWNQKPKIKSKDKIFLLCLRWWGGSTNSLVSLSKQTRIHTNTKDIFPYLDYESEKDHLLYIFMFRSCSFNKKKMLLKEFRRISEGWLGHLMWIQRPFKYFWVFKYSSPGTGWTLICINISD